MPCTVIPLPPPPLATRYLVIDGSRRSDSGERPEVESGWRADERKAGRQRNFSLPRSHVLIAWNKLV